MKTAVYVDGFNFYYGCLHNTPYKWLDLPALLNSIIFVQNPKSELVMHRYFTADVPSKFSRKGTIANQSQDQYLKALRLRHGNTFEVHKGYYTAEKYSALSYNKPPALDNKTEIWKLEEKQTDVAMATYSYRDLAINKELRQIVICTNDTDLEPPLELIRNDMPHVQIGLIIPRSPKSKRPPNGQLSRHAHWTRTHILESELRDHQLPDRVNAISGKRNKTAVKPNHW